MERYRIVQELGDGTYGSVSLAIKIDNGQKTAVKKMKKQYRSWEEVMSLKELKALKKLHHPNIVRLYEVIREKNNLYFIFEYMEMNLYQLMNSRKDLFPESSVRNMVYQILQGLSYVHRNGFFHRDLKPENILCCGPGLVKIADFGLAREVRWYRAPEILLRSGNYSCPIDIWAVGCVTAELYTLNPIFPGVSEIDQIFKICSVLGTPTNWEEGQKMATKQNFKFPRLAKVNLSTVVHNVSPEGIYLLERLLQWDPHTRPTAQNSLRLPYFHLGAKPTSAQHVVLSDTMRRRQTKIGTSQRICIGSGSEEKNFRHDCGEPNDSRYYQQLSSPTNTTLVNDSHTHGRVFLMKRPIVNAKIHYLSKARYVSGKSTNLDRENKPTDNRFRNNMSEQSTLLPGLPAQPDVAGRTNWAAKYLY